MRRRKKQRGGSGTQAYQYAVGLNSDARALALRLAVLGVVLLHEALKLADLVAVGCHLLGVAISTGVLL